MMAFANLNRLPSSRIEVAAELSGGADALPLEDVQRFLPASSRSMRLSAFFPARRAEMLEKFCVWEPIMDLPACYLELSDP
jgi:hypothetical protein